MKLQFPHSEVQRWADEYEVPEVERGFPTLRHQVSQRGHLLLDELKLLAEWKSSRVRPLIATNDAAFWSAPQKLDGE